MVIGWTKRQLYLRHRPKENPCDAEWSLQNFSIFDDGGENAAWP